MAGAAYTDGTDGIIHVIMPAFIAAISGMTGAMYVANSATSGGKTVATCDANSKTIDATYGAASSGRTVNSCGNRGKDVQIANSTAWAENPGVLWAQDHVIAAAKCAVAAADAMAIPVLSVAVVGAVKAEAAAAVVTVAAEAAEAMADAEVAAATANGK